MLFIRVLLTVLLLAFMVWGRLRLRKEILSGVPRTPLNVFHYFFITSALSTWIASWFIFSYSDLFVVSYAAPFLLAILYGIGKFIHDYLSGKGISYPSYSGPKKKSMFSRSSLPTRVRPKSSFRGFGGGKSGGGGTSGKW